MIRARIGAAQHASVPQTCPPGPSDGRVWGRETSSAAYYPEYRTLSPEKQQWWEDEGGPRTLAKFQELRQQEDEAN